MNGWVLDSSFALALGLPDETSESAERFMARLTPGTPLWVPTLWGYEIANALLTAERRGRIREAEAARVLEIAFSLPLEIDSSSTAETLWRLRLLGKEHGLTAYDAAYLELALRRQLSLATLDRDLLKAAKTAGVQTTRPHII